MDHGAERFPHTLTRTVSFSVPITLFPIAEALRETQFVVFVRIHLCGLLFKRRSAFSNLKFNLYPMKTYLRPTIIGSVPAIGERVNGSRGIVSARTNTVVFRKDNLVFLFYCEVTATSNPFPPKKGIKSWKVANYEFSINLSLIRNYKNEEKEMEILTKHNRFTSLEDVVNEFWEDLKGTGFDEDIPYDMIEDYFNALVWEFHGSF